MHLVLSLGSGPVCRRLLLCFCLSGGAGLPERPSLKASGRAKSINQFISVSVFVFASLSLSLSLSLSCSLTVIACGVRACLVAGPTMCHANHQLGSSRHRHKVLLEVL